MGAKHWTKQEKDIIRNNYKSMKQQDIQKLLPHKTLSAISGQIHRIYLENGEVGWIKWSNEENQLLKDNYLKYTTKELCKMLPNRTLVSVKGQTEKLGLLVCFPWKEEELEILKLYYGKIPANKICKKYLPNRTTMAIIGQAHKLGLIADQTLTSRKHCRNDNFFDEPTLESCYYAGFIAADGTIVNNNIAIHISTIDRCVLENFKNAIEYSGPIRRFTKDNQGPDKINTDVSILKISSSRMLIKLKEHYNIVPNKSLILEPPKDYINGDLALSYIRGLIDGDGSVSIYPTFKLSLVGTEKLLLWVKSILDQLSPVQLKPSKVVRDGRGKNCYQLSYNCKRAKEIHTKLAALPLNFKFMRKWDLPSIIEYKKYYKEKLTKRKAELKIIRANNPYRPSISSIYIPSAYSGVS